MITIKDVAKKANVSVATVSRVINNTDNVQEKTKIKVQNAIDELSYSPNLLGRNLRRQETKKILVLINTMSNPFYSRIIKGIEEKALPNGYTVMVCMTHGNHDIEERYVDMIRTKLVDGAVFFTTEQLGEALTEQLRDTNVVQACEPCYEFDTPIVSIDNEKASFDATNYLIRKGHKSIAFFGAGEIYDSSVQRQYGYKMALEHNGISVDDRLIFNEGFSFNAGIRATNKLLELKIKPFPTAIFCISDSSAAGAMRTLEQEGIKCPTDISIMGFDNTQIAQIFIPSITTLEQPQYEIGYKAMELLLEKINGGNNPNQTIILQHKIIERESVTNINGTLVGMPRQAMSAVSCEIE